jgi:ATP-dependent Zn protease
MNFFKREEKTRFHRLTYILLVSIGLSLTPVIRAEDQEPTEIQSSRQALTEPEIIIEDEKKLTNITKDEGPTDRVAYEKTLALLVDKVYRTLDTLCERVALIVNNNHLRLDKETKKKAIDRLIAYRSFLNPITRESLVEVSPEKIHMLTLIAEKMAHNLQRAIDSTLKDFPPFNLEKIAAQIGLSKGGLRKSTPELPQLQARIARLAKKSAEINKKSESVGLTAFNKAFRTLEKINNTYHLTSYLAWTAGITLGAGVIYYMLPHEATNGIENRLPGWLATRLHSFKEWIGEPFRSKLGYSDPDLQAGKVTYAHNFLSNFVDFGVTKIALGVAIGAIIAHKWSDFTDWLDRKRAQIASYLRGGPVIKISEGMYLKDPTITLEDVIGNEQNKEELEPLIQYLVDYDNFDRAGLVPETGYLLVGQSRTGKSYTAEGVAGSVKQRLAQKGSIEQLRFVTLTPAVFKSLGVKPGENRTSGILNTLLGAREFAPVVVFIDEFDMGAWQRERDTEALGELLTAMSELNKDKVRKVIVFAATNAPKNIDLALRKPGRFGKELYFTYPTVEERFEFLCLQLSKRAIIIDKEFAAFLAQVAQETEGVPYDGLTRLVIMALLRAKMRHGTLEPSDFEMALDHEIRHIQPAMLPSMSEQEQHLVAAHLAGHVIAGMALNAKNVVTKVTICPLSPKIKEEMILDKYNKDKKQKTTNIDNSPEFRHGAIFTLASKKDKIMDYADSVIEAKIKLAGHLAETMLLGSCSYTYHPKDETKAMNIAKKICFTGNNTEDMTKKMREDLLQQAHDLVETWKKDVIILLEQHKDQLELLNAALFNHKIVPGGLVRMIMEESTNEQLRNYVTKTPQQLLEELMKEQSISDETSSDAGEIQQEDLSSPETSDIQAEAVAQIA